MFVNSSQKKKQRWFLFSCIILRITTTGSDDSHVGMESMEERSVNTETGLMDTQWTDETFSPEEKRRKKKERKEKKEKKQRENAKKGHRQKEDQDESDASGNSTQY